MGKTQTEQMPEQNPEQEAQANAAQQDPKQESAKQAEAPKKRYIVAIRFQDSREYQTGAQPQVYEEGDDVSHFDQARIDFALSHNIIKEAE